MRACARQLPCPLSASAISIQEFLGGPSASSYRARRSVIALNLFCCATSRAGGPSTSSAVALQVRRSHGPHARWSALADGNPDPCGSAWSASDPYAADSLRGSRSSAREDASESEGVGCGWLYLRDP